MVTLFATAFAFGLAPQNDKLSMPVRRIAVFVQPVSAYVLGYALVSMIDGAFSIDLNALIKVLLSAVPGLLGLVMGLWLDLRGEKSALENRLSGLEVKAVLVLFTRYRELIVKHQSEMTSDVKDCDPEHLIRLCNEVIENHQRYPFDKLCRWMGFVQGVLATQEIIQVEEERDFSRPLLHAIHDYVPPTYG
jgi:hypothetical protein